MKPRVGQGLIEMAAVMGLLAIMMTVAAWLIWELVDAQEAVRRGVIEPRTLSRLAETFREDAHAAVTLRRPTAQAAIASDKPPEGDKRTTKTPHDNVQQGCSLFDAEGNEIASYRFMPGQAVRTQPGPDGIIRETFRLADGARASITVSKADLPEHPAIATLLITPIEETLRKRPSCYDALRTDARLGRDAWLRRAARPPAGAKPASRAKTNQPKKAAKPSKPKEINAPEKAAAPEGPDGPSEAAKRKGSTDE